MTLQLQVPSMVCDGCANTVTQAIHSVDSAAVATVDLTSKMITVVAHTATPETITAAILSTGHTVNS
jgi:copper chaperone